MIISRSRKVVRETDEEKLIFMGEGAVMMDFTKDKAISILCQAMFDETLRLRNCFGRKERDSIRRFLIESFQVVFADVLNIENPEGH